jgi:hypothetical protein
MRNFLFICFIIVFGHAYSQKSEQGFIKEIKYNYVKGEFNSAKEGLEEALMEYPSSKQLLTLKSLVEAEGYAVDVTKPVSTSPKAPKGTTVVNPPKDRGITPQPPRENSDPDNDGFIGSKDKCPSEFGEINGCPDSDGDKVPDNRDNCPDVPGSISNKGCKIIKQIQYNFKMTEQNLFSWNPEIGKSGAKTTITIDNYSGGKKTFDVTGLSKFNLVTKDSKFDGVECKIILTIQGDADLKIVGLNQLSETVTCSGNHRNK